MSAPTEVAAPQRVERPAGAQIQARVRAFLETNFYVMDPADLEPDVSLVERGVVDSTGMLEVIAFLETEFRIRIRDDEVVPANLGSVRHMVAFVARKQLER